ADPGHWRPPAGSTGQPGATAPRRPYHGDLSAQPATAHSNQGQRSTAGLGAESAFAPEPLGRIHDPSDHTPRGGRAEPGHAHAGPVAGQPGPPAQRDHARRIPKTGPSTPAIATGHSPAESSRDRRRPETGPAPER